jgi:hypothetical protein
MKPAKYSTPITFSRETLAIIYSRYMSYEMTTCTHARELEIRVAPRTFPEATCALM